MNKKKVPALLKPKHEPLPPADLPPVADHHHEEAMLAEASVSNFTEGLKTALDVAEGHAWFASTDRAHLQDFLASPDRPLKKIILRRMERRAHLFMETNYGVGPHEVIDWTTIPWEQIIATLLPILLKILLLFIGI